MVLLNSDEFLKKLTALVADDSGQAAKALRISYKRHIPNARSWRNSKSDEQQQSEDGLEPVCLVRARLGDCKISTHVTSDTVENFTRSINEISDMISLEEKPLDS